MLDQSLLGAIEFYGLKYVEVFIYLTLAFMLSVVSRSSALAIGLTLISMFVGPQFVALFTDYSMTKYLLFTNRQLKYKLLIK